MQANLIVIRSRDIASLADFYSMLGCTFEKHSHGKGPEHYAHDQGGVVFEIYPLKDDQAPTTSVRIGFKVKSIDVILEKVKSSEKGKVLAEAKVSEWGKRAVIEDPEGHKVELTEKA